MSNYLKNLADHPGVPVAALVTISFTVAGMQRDEQWWLGLAVSAVMWIPVLWTARFTPHRED